MVNYKDYYYKYKALKYYLKNNSIENQKQMKGGSNNNDDEYSKYYDFEIDTLIKGINEKKGEFYIILEKLENIVLYKNEDITLYYKDFYEHLYSLLESVELFEEYKKENENLYKILFILYRFLHHNAIIEDMDYNDFEIIKDKDTENSLLKIKGKGNFAPVMNIEQFITYIDIENKINDNISDKDRGSSTNISSFYLKYTGEGGLQNNMNQNNMK